MPRQDSVISASTKGPFDGRSDASLTQQRSFQVLLRGGSVSDNVKGAHESHKRHPIYQLMRTSRDQRAGPIEERKRHDKLKKNGRNDNRKRRANGHKNKQKPERSDVRNGSKREKQATRSVIRDLHTANKMSPLRDESVRTLPGRALDPSQSGQNDDQTLNVPTLTGSWWPMRRRGCEHLGGSSRDDIAGVHGR